MLPPNHPKNPKSDAKSNDKLLRYPFSKLNESDDYMRIEIFDFEPLGLGQAGGGPGGDTSKNLRLRTTDEVFEGGNKVPLKNYYITYTRKYCR